jgi:hypothetical protein
MFHRAIRFATIASLNLDPRLPPPVALNGEPLRRPSGSNPTRRTLADRLLRSRWNSVAMAPTAFMDDRSAGLRRPMRVSAFLCAGSPARYGLRLQDCIGRSPRRRVTAAHWVSD